MYNAKGLVHHASLPPEFFVPRKPPFFPNDGPPRTMTPPASHSGGLLVTTAPGHDNLRALLAQPWPAIEAASRPLAGGRGGVRELPGGMLIRHCRRGGALGGLLGDRHWSPRAAWDEMQMSERLLRDGVAVAEVLGVRAEKRGIAVVLVLFIFSVVFWSAFEQAPTSLNLFASINKYIVYS